jgi:hypothetical protein
VKAAFLDGIIKEEVYIEKPWVFEVSGKESHVCRLKKALYRLKQALRAWYSKIDGYLQSMGFPKSKVNSNLYYIFFQTDRCILELYVDDFFMMGAKKLIEGCKADMAAESR